MNRKAFIKKAGMVLAAASVPLPGEGQSTSEKKKSSGDLKPKIVRKGEGDVMNVIGDLQTHQISGADTDNQIVEWINNVEPGTGIPPHIHTKEDEIFRVLKGEVEVMVGDKVTVLKQGDVAFAPRNVVHSWKIVGTGKASMSTSAFPAGIEVMFKELAALPPGPPDFEKVAKICGEHGITFV